MQSCTVTFSAFMNESRSKKNPSPGPEIIKNVRAQKCKLPTAAGISTFMRRINYYDDLSLKIL